MKDELGREVYTVTINRDDQTGIVKSEVWESGGQRHRIDGPAIIYRDPVTGVVTCEQWFKDDWPHRADGPAATYRDATTGKITRRMWYYEGKFFPPEKRPGTATRPRSTGQNLAPASLPKNAL